MEEDVDEDEHLVEIDERRYELRDGIRVERERRNGKHPLVIR